MFYNYFTTRNAEKTYFTTLITKYVERVGTHYVAPDLSNVLAMVSTCGKGTPAIVHVYDKNLPFMGCDTSIENLAEDSWLMSEEYDDGASGDFEDKIPSGVPVVGGNDVTFYMDVKPLCPSGEYMDALPL